MTTHRTDPELLNTVLQLLTEQGASAGLAEGIRLLVNEAMRQQRSQALQAQPYERTKTRQGHSNGFKPKTLETRLGPIQFQVPQVRGGLEFYPSALEKGVRSEQALKLALAEMYIQGVSTRKVSAIVEQLCGSSVSSTQVSQCAAKLDAQLQAWRSRPLGAFPYLVLDARYEKVRHGGQLLDCAILIALGIDPQGKRCILGVSVALSEAEVHWRQFLQSLQQRGLHGLQFIVSDDHPGLGTARTAVFPSVPWQRCQFHLQQNAQAYVPRLEQRAPVAEAIRTVFNSPDRPSAEARLKELVTQYASSAPKLATWLETNLPQGFTVFGLPPAHQLRMRTTNALERVNQELKRRTRVARLFPNEASLLRLVSALLNEISDEWQTTRVYLNM
ncbi:MAG TPA: IS256 family transposase [Candidatus Saccharimonadales bacterium]|jgi:transposase-like protein|nr:IS256 family transposase [Candidatus Saccharimonadales bacterium]